MEAMSTVDTAETQQKVALPEEALVVESSMRGSTVTNEADDDADDDEAASPVGAERKTSKYSVHDDSLSLEVEASNPESGGADTLPVEISLQDRGLEDGTGSETSKSEIAQEAAEERATPPDAVKSMSDPAANVTPPKPLADDLEEEEDGFEVVNEADVPDPDELSAYDLEIKKVGAEIIFPPSGSFSFQEPWSNLKWLSYTRKVRFCCLCTKMVIIKKKWFGGTDAETYQTRKLAIYEEPNLILILRPPIDAKEVQTVLDLGDEPVNPRSYLVAENVIDPMTCKLRLSPLTTPTSIESTGGELASPHRQSCFELVTPTETLLLSALRPKEDKAIVSNSVGFLETKNMEIAVGNALVAAHCPPDQLSSSDVAWKHQLVLGTLSSFVISGSQKQLEKALATAIARNRDGFKTVPTHVIDQVDDSGRTALHYACMRRNSAAVTALIGTGANASIPIPCEGRGEILPIQIAAKALDHMSLSTILSAPRRPNPNAVDSEGRTVMYLAATEGTSDDPTALSKCLSALAAWGGEMGTGVNPVRILAGKWMYPSLSAVLAHEGFRYPLKKEGISVGAMYSYPLHAALATLRSKIAEIGKEIPDHGFGGGDVLKSQLRGTLLVLLEHGFEPNERIESSTDRLSDYVGFTPLQMLAAAAMDAEQLSKSKMVKISTSTFSSVASTLAGAADVLVQCGARLNVEPPPTERRVAKPTPSGGKREEDIATDLPPIDRSSLKIEGNKDMVDLLGGKERLEACRKTWLDDNSVEGTDKLIIRQCKEYAESDQPGGSSDRSCAICWRAFGAIMNRKHKCRVSRKYVCDECSAKRIVEGGQEHRLSDGQFLLARKDAARQKSDRIKAQQEDLQRRKEQMEQVRKKRVEKEQAEESQRDSLFGNLMEKAAVLLTGEEEQVDNIGGLHNKLGETRDALNQRGQRLGDLSEKTEKLMNASEDFAKMAKDLENSQRGLFW